MAFIWPWMLFSLLLLPIFVWIYRRLRRRSVTATRRLGPLGQVQDSAGLALGERQRDLPYWFFLGGLTLLLVSLARPEMTVRLPRIEGTVILAFDTSNSMLADDLDPTRIAVSKEIARGFVDAQPANILMGVVAFSNGGFVVQPPTDVRLDVYDAIERVTAGGSTSLGQGIFTALNTLSSEQLTLDPEAVDVESGTIDLSQFEIEEFSSAVILLLTDGENIGSPDPIQIAELAASAGVRIYPIGVGTEAGAVVEVDGFNLMTRLDEVALDKIANVTNGVYYRADNEAALAEIYESVDLQLTLDPDMMEVTSLFAGGSLLLVLIGAALSMLWFGRMP